MKISEYKQLFLNEAREILDSANNVLVALEKDPSNMALLNDLFRYSHTLKSMAQSMEYQDIARLTHAMETVLSLFKTGELKADMDTVTLLFEALDGVGILIDAVRGGETKSVKVTSLVNRFERISSTHSRTYTKGRKKNADEHSAHVSLTEAQSVRVQLTHLDDLMDIAGELSISGPRLTRMAETIGNNSLEQAVNEMATLISRLQGQMLHVRLVPLEYIFTPYSRMVRDMAADEGKEIDLVIEGSHIGMDRSIQAEINGSLLHLLKNAVAHGIEDPEERKKQEKPGRGKVTLAARREGDFVVIELSDDGRGIDIKDVRRIALARNVVTPEDISNLSPEETVMLVTQPGYTGTEKVTESAGRGVGMNAVRIKVESFGGTLTIDTRPNRGTTFIIKLPLSMAVVQVMLVGVADETYCIPLSHIAETIKVSRRTVRTMEQNPVIPYRDTVLPLLDLGERLGFGRGNGRKMKGDGRISVVVVEVGRKMAGLVVDNFLGQQEAVVKPLAGLLREIDWASGATILGTGMVAFILDVPAVVS